MSKLDLITHFYEYNQWANDRLLGVASGLSAEELSAGRGASFDSILDSFAHIAAAQVNWLERWVTGSNRIPTLDLQKMPDLGTVRASFLASHGGLREFVSDLTDERLEAPQEFRDSAGNRQASPLWQLMLHVANHGTYHRGEIAMMLTGGGHSPGDLDFNFWEYEHHPQRRASAEG